MRSVARLLQSQPDLAVLSERLLASGLATAPSAAAIAALARNEAALQRLAPRLFGTLAGTGGSGVARQGGAARLQREVQQVGLALALCCLGAGGRLCVTRRLPQHSGGACTPEPIAPACPLPLPHAAAGAGGALAAAV